MLTPIAANTIEKLSSWPSWTPLVGAASGLRSVDCLLTRPACRQIWAAICVEEEPSQHRRRGGGELTRGRSEEEGRRRTSL